VALNNPGPFTLTPLTSLLFYISSLHLLHLTSLLHQYHHQTPVPEKSSPPPCLYQHHHHHINNQSPSTSNIQLTHAPAQQPTLTHAQAQQPTLTHAQAQQPTLTPPPHRKQNQPILATISSNPTLLHSTQHTPHTKQYGLER
jgi:hypothetical protein